MNYKGILFNQARNKRRIEQLRNENYGIRAVDYDKDKVQISGKKSIVESQVIALNENPEYLELLRYTEAVDRVIDCLNYRQREAYDLYFRDKKKPRDIITRYAGEKSTFFRDINLICEMLEKELWD